MATGYARWFQQAYRRRQRAADNCSNCRQSLCQTADHFERWWDLLLQHSVRQAEHQQWGMLFQFSDGTVYQHHEEHRLAASTQRPEGPSPSQRGPRLRLA